MGCNRQPLAGLARRVLLGKVVVGIGLDVDTLLDVADALLCRSRTYPCTVMRYRPAEAEGDHVSMGNCGWGYRGWLGDGNNLNTPVQTLEEKNRAVHVYTFFLPVILMRLPIVMGARVRYE